MLKRDRSQENVLIEETREWKIKEEIEYVYLWTLRWEVSNMICITTTIDEEKMLKYTVLARLSSNLFKPIDISQLGRDKVAYSL